MPIRQLATDVAAKIAAGEVVERPASVVKELIENSIDAGASQIRVELANGGLQLMRIIDNGCGIPADELLLALSRHATSKVIQIDDLEHIRSLGFRGEALASIAAVAELTLLSHTQDAAQGAQVSTTNGHISEVNVAASPVGTTVTVRNLFSAVPARLKFLKSRNTEVSHCLHMLQQYALAYPEIRFSVTSDSRHIFATSGDGQLLSVLIEMYGLQVAEQMSPISNNDASHSSEYPLVTGYVSHPTCYKSTRQHIAFFVNRRWVLSRMLTAAVEEAYHSLLMTGRHPIAVINIQLDPAQLDVNVHPAKTEIRFLKERRVFAAVMHAVRQTVLNKAQIPTWQPHDEGSANVPLVQPHIVAFPQDNPWQTVTEEETGTKPPLLSKLWQSHVHMPAAEQMEALTDLELPPVSSKDTSVATSETLPMEAAVVSSLTPQDAQSRRLPPLRVLGQLAQSYIVTEGPDGLYLIDQHAAHERILLERMVAALQARTQISQMLLTPMQLELAPREIEAIEEHTQQLEQIGFTLEIRDDRALVIHAVPNVLVKHINAHSLRDLLRDLTAPEHDGQPAHSETWEEYALANVACKAAIKANYFLTVSEMREMAEQLEQTNAPYSCCHGRPTMLQFSLSTLAREFGRR